MSTEPVDYTAILGDLEAKKAALEHTIASFRQAMALGALGQMTATDGTVSSLSVPSMSGGEVPAGAFLSKSIPDATRLYLEIVKKKQTTQEIADALRKGGMESTSKDFVGTVYAGLTRARRSPNSGIVKVGKHWGLTSWWPKGVVSAGSAQAAKKKKNRKPAKVAHLQPKQTVATGPQIVNQSAQNKSASERILELLHTKPGIGFVTREITEKLGLKATATPLTLANLVRSHKVEKTPDGRYTVPIRVGAAV